jgi:hypothetical protein
MQTVRVFEHEVDVRKGEKDDGNNTDCKQSKLQPQVFDQS